MSKEIIKTTGIVLAIYIASYFMTGVIGGIANLFIPIYGLNLVKKQNVIAIKTLLALMLVFNLGVIAYLLFGNIL